MPFADTATVKLAGVVVAVGAPSSSHVTPLLVVLMLDVTLNPIAPAELETETVCRGGLAWPVSKLNVSAAELTVSVGLLETLKETWTVCGLLPPLIALKVIVPE
jgi:hypothetical protein